MKLKKVISKKRKKADFRYYKEFDNHEMLIAFTDIPTKLKGYIGIHNTNFGPALGGTRLGLYSSEEQAIKDVLSLSMAMTYKCALVGLPWGGGKAVIVLDPTMDRDLALASYAKIVEKLGGIFKTGTDVGIYDSDVKKMAKYTNQMLGVSKGDRGKMTTSNLAALGVYYSIKAALGYYYGSEDLKGRKIGIKGVGKLGGELAKLLHDEGALLFISDIDTERLQLLSKKYPDIKIVPTSEIHRQKLDVYSPCALGHDITDRKVAELRAKIVAGGANNQLASEKAGDLMYSRGIHYVPDYVANAGGLIYVADELEPDGFNQARVLKRTEGIKRTLIEIFELSTKENISTHRVADKIALSRINDKGKSNGNSSIS